MVASARVILLLLAWAVGSFLSSEYQVVSSVVTLPP